MLWFLSALVPTRNDIALALLTPFNLPDSLKAKFRLCLRFLLMLAERLGA